MPIMPTRTSRATLTGNRVFVRPPRRADETAFIAATQASRRLHGRWVSAPQTPAAYALYLSRFARAARLPLHAALLVCRSGDGALAGTFNLSEIVRGAFQSAYLGYYAFVPLAGHGYMTEGFALTLDFAFRQLGLHRVEANVQPDNTRSLAFLDRAGFVREGYSRRYIKLAGRWRDHVRFAMLAEDWRARRAKRRAAIGLPR